MPGGTYVFCVRINREEVLRLTVVIDFGGSRDKEFARGGGGRDSRPKNIMIAHNKLMWRSDQAKIVHTGAPGWKSRVCSMYAALVGHLSSDDGHLSTELTRPRGCS